jgi:hypothetical protein
MQKADDYPEYYVTCFDIFNNRLRPVYYLEFNKLFGSCGPVYKTQGLNQVQIPDVYSFTTFAERSNLNTDKEPRVSPLQVKHVTVNCILLLPSPAVKII